MLMGSYCVHTSKNVALEVYFTIAQCDGSTFYMVKHFPLKVLMTPFDVCKRHDVLTKHLPFKAVFLGPCCIVLCN